MSIIDELRYPRRWYTKLLIIILALIFFALLATLAISAVLTYWIVKPQRSSSEINLNTFPGRPDEVTFTVTGLGERQGWFFPGLVGAPTIVLLHGYESSRGELLTLVSALQDHQYNAFVFDFAAHGMNDGITTFGYREADEVRAAIDTLAKRQDVDPARFGVWGYNLGAYAGLREAEKDSRVRAIVLDSVSANLKRVAGVPILFIQAADDPELAAITRQMFLKAPEPREEAIIAHGNFVNLADDEKREYENRVVSFVLTRLPVVQSAPAAAAPAAKASAKAAH